ncbi:MAG: threonine--tRNA ligase [Chloroflexi bacterium]|nr:threonine--tRNA ligase [Chloroflexota bacterium]
MSCNGQQHTTDLDTMRHSTAHVMAKAVQHLYPGSKLGIGPTTEDGFYYDIDVAGKQLSVDDLPAIEDEMRRIIAADEAFVRREVPRDEALAESASRGEDFKLEIIRSVPQDETISYYDTGSDWTDLCRGPHVPSSGKIGAFKLLSVAGAYWRGDEKRPMLQRIYGTTWPTQEELDRYLWRLEEAKRRDHRRLGRELDLFSVSEDVGPGLILWHPKGAIIRIEAEDFARKTLAANGYDWVFTPHIGRSRLWEISGHLGFYKESMYSPMDVEGEEYIAKPMNCPFHIQIYKNQIRSYRDLPMRLAEYGTVYRYERSGVLHGLTRVRGFTQDDAHIFCRPDQVEEEIRHNLDLSLFVLRAFGLTDFTAYLSTRPDKYVGDPADWERATEALRRAAEAAQLRLEVDEGGGAFYGPKIDLKVHDALGREWQLSTIQFDFNMSARFDLEYIGEDGQAHRPYMVHRALLGSMERFFGVLIEHFAGAFPLWLAPVQVAVVPIADRHLEYAQQVADELKKSGFRVDVDGRRERMQNKIRQAETQKVPYILVVGDRDIQAGAVSVRARGEGDLGAMERSAFLARLREERDTHAVK